MAGMGQFLNEQVMIMVDHKKRYVAALHDELEAAKLYDKVAVQYHGIKVSAACVNFHRQKLILTALRLRFLSSLPQRESD
jgi:hypothetical protein